MDSLSCLTFHRFEKSNSWSIKPILKIPMASCVRRTLSGNCSLRRHKTKIVVNFILLSSFYFIPTKTGKTLSKCISDSSELCWDKKPAFFSSESEFLKKVGSSLCTYLNCWRVGQKTGILQITNQKAINSNIVEFSYFVT